MRTYLSPIGYNTTSVTRVLLSRGIEAGDTVVLLRPASDTDNGRGKEAITDVTRMLEEIEPDLSVEVERIPHEQFPTAVLTCSNLLRAAEGHVIVNLGGGARDILLPFTIAVLAHASQIDTALMFSDIDGQVREWELPLLTADISRSTQETLERIANSDDSMTVPQLDEQMSTAKSTITRHVSLLDESGLVQTWIDGKTKHTQITLTGKLLLDEI